MSNKRLYKSGTIWCFWRWSEFKQDQYIDRLHLVKTPWFAICLHWINKPDPEPHLHDHPVSFLSIILRGAYDEIREDGTHHRKYYNYISATDKHTIIGVKPKTLTLAFMGPKVREWGFHTESGWVYWKDYYVAQKAGKQL